MKRLAVLALTAVLVGCGSLHWPTWGGDEYWLKSDAPRPASRVESLLAYADYARGLSAAESAKEHERMRAAFAAPNRTDVARLQYALLLAVSAAPARDLPRARQLLEPVAKADNADADLRRLAGFLVAAFGDQLDAERRHRDEQRRAGDLEQKLDALKSIEQRIIQRGAPERKR